jgi:hypothetical protein
MSPKRRMWSPSPFLIGFWSCPFWIEKINIFWVGQRSRWYQESLDECDAWPSSASTAHADRRPSTSTAHADRVHEKLPFENAIWIGSSCLFLCFRDFVRDFSQTAFCHSQDLLESFLRYWANGSKPSCGMLSRMESAGIRGIVMSIGLWASLGYFKLNDQTGICPRCVAGADENIARSDLYLLCFS